MAVGHGRLRRLRPRYSPPFTTLPLMRALVARLRKRSRNSSKGSPKGSKSPPSWPSNGSARWSHCLGYRRGGGLRRGCGESGSQRRGRVARGLLRPGWRHPEGGQDLPTPRHPRWRACCLRGSSTDLETLAGLSWASSNALRVSRMLRRATTPTLGASSSGRSTPKSVPLPLARRAHRCGHATSSSSRSPGLSVVPRHLRQSTPTRKREVPGHRRRR